MKNLKSVIAGAILGILFFGLSSLALSGTEPSPFQPEINQLGAVTNILHSADFRFAKTLAHPPDPCVPPDPCNNPDLNGALNRINAINNQVMSADDMVRSMIEEVMGFEPTPFREDLIPALEIVRGAAQGIATKALEFTPPPDVNIPVDHHELRGPIR